MKEKAIAFRKQIGKNIRCLRTLKGYTQKQLAAHLKMSIANLSNIENGYTATNQFTLHQIATFFAVTENDIINFHLLNHFN